MDRALYVPPCASGNEPGALLPALLACKRGNLMPRRAAQRAAEVAIAGVRITHPDKLLWPADGITKLDLARYYERVGPTMLPYLRDRPLTLRPFPGGIESSSYYLKNAPSTLPDWVPTWTDVAESTGKPVRFVLGGDLPTLIWCAQYNAIEVHPWLSRVDRPDFPDWAVIDLDPGERTPFELVVRAARAFRQELERRGLRAYPKLSGSSGLHLYLPLERVHRFDAVREYVHALAQSVARSEPETLTLDYVTADRHDLVLADYAQNARGKSTVAPYSARPKPGAPVSAPIRWEELEDPTLRPNRWTLRSLPERIERVGDLFADALAHPQRLPGLAVDEPQGER
jgi:bifunctional non-homologous end joining protein LigD